MYSQSITGCHLRAKAGQDRYRIFRVEVPQVHSDLDICLSLRYLSRNTERIFGRAFDESVHIIFQGLAGKLIYRDQYGQSRLIFLLPQVLRGILKRRRCFCSMECSVILVLVLV